MEDHIILDEIFKKLNYPNQIIFFTDGNAAVDYLNAMENPPFLILSDINMPRMNGFEVRDKICRNEKLNSKCIPYLFFSTSVDKKAVEEAYAMCVQGFFIKPATMNELQSTIGKIIDYWQECYAPSQFN